MQNKSLDELTKEAIQNSINDFHYYIKELGLDRAKEIVLAATCLKPVIKYINEYKA